MNFEGKPWLYREVIVTKAGVGARLTVHPATIVQARYNGSYMNEPSGCASLCIPDGSSTRHGAAGTLTRSSVRRSGEALRYRNGLSAAAIARQPPMTT